MQTLDCRHWRIWAFFLATANPITYKREKSCAQVAQLVEQRTENPRVGGSIPPLGTIYSSLYSNS